MQRKLIVLAYADGLKQCPHCLVHFAPNPRAPHQKFCSDSCCQRDYERRKRERDSAVA